MSENTIRILGIESSCDETAAAVIENGRRILSSVIATQIEIHKRYGGVFPEVASRQHVMSIYPVIDEVMNKAHLSFSDLDAIGVTRGPGLAGSLVVGVNAAKGLALASGLPIIAVNHLEAHIYSSWLYEDVGDGEIPPAPSFPAIVLLVSGGHSEIILVRDHLHYERLGGTVDDAAGEAFDKVARLIGLEYPGGPSIQKAAADADATLYHFPCAKMSGTYDFSFSGVKTAVLRQTQKMGDEMVHKDVKQLAAGFQKSVVDILFEKTMDAARKYEAQNIIIAGGVSANALLRETFLGQEEFKVFIPRLSFCTDNAAMVGAAAYQRFKQDKFDDLSFDIFPNWPLSRVSL